MSEPEQLSLQQVAVILDLERVRLYRLGRSFGFAPSDVCIPRTVVNAAIVETDHESRYRIILQWLVAGAKHHGGNRARGPSS